MEKQLRTDIDLLNERIKLLEAENALIKHTLKMIQEELETFKNPGTCSLQLALKYPLPHI